jgi:hypothetical protein
MCKSKLGLASEASVSAVINLLWNTLGILNPADDLDSAT